jgi:hypothetical protein
VNPWGTDAQEEALIAAAFQWDNTRQQVEAFAVRRTTQADRDEWEALVTASDQTHTTLVAAIAALRAAR